MGRVISVSNQKGGVGKTTTAINLSACLGEKGKKVLLIDIDPQANATSGFGIQKNNLEFTIYELLLGICDINQCLLHNIADNIDLIPANINLSGAEVELVNLENKEFLLKERIETVSDQYDYMIIDCPPSLSLLTINAMTASDSVLIPIQCEYYALEGLSQLLDTISLIKERLNDRLYINGIVFTMFDSRTNLSTQVVENVRGNLEIKIYQTLIPRNVRLAESPSYGMPIVLYDSKSTGAQAYRLFAAEFIESDGDV